MTCYARARGPASGRRPKRRTASAIGVTADGQLAVLHTGGRYVRFATAGNRDPVAGELPSGRVVELVTRRHPPPETIVNVALYSTSRARFCEAREAFDAREPVCSRAGSGSRAASGQIGPLHPGGLHPRSESADQASGEPGRLIICECVS